MIKVRGGWASWMRQLSLIKRISSPLQLREENLSSNIFTCLGLFSWMWRVVCRARLTAGDAPSLSGNVWIKEFLRVLVSEGVGGVGGARWAAVLLMQEIGGGRAEPQTPASVYSSQPSALHNLSFNYSFSFCSSAWWAARRCVSVSLHHADKFRNKESLWSSSPDLSGSKLFWSKLESIVSSCLAFINETEYL